MYNVPVGGGCYILYVPCDLIKKGRENSPLMEGLTMTGDRRPSERTSSTMNAKRSDTVHDSDWPYPGGGGGGGGGQTNKQ